MLEVGKHYIVTKPSDDGTFLLDDHVYLDEDGCIVCVEAGGWITKEDADEAIKGARFISMEKDYQLDTKRLDWLSEHPDFLSIKPQWKLEQQGLILRCLSLHEFTDIRALIDAAMKSDV